jgi:hypothetical protein
MGVVLIVGGAIGFIVAVFLSVGSYRARRPGAYEAGAPPRPGTGDVPSWISGLYLLSLLAVIAGIVVLVAT